MLSMEEVDIDALCEKNTQLKKAFCNIVAPIQSVMIRAFWKAVFSERVFHRWNRKRRFGSRWSDTNTLMYFKIDALIGFSSGILCIISNLGRVKLIVNN